MMAKHCGVTAGLWVFILIALCPVTNGQGMGNGMSKYTRGQSDPRSCLRFFKKYMDGIEAPDDCLEGRCECATQGRFQVGGGLLQAPFGVHSINCSYHPYGEHSLADVEKMQAEEVNDFKDGYNQHLDSHLGLWVADLRSTMEELERGGEIYYPMKWTEGRQTYYSVMTVPCSGYYIEFLSEKATGISADKFHETKEIRFPFGNYSHPDEESKVVMMSRATTKIDAMIDFYTNVIEGNLVQNVTVDGVQIAWVYLKGAPKVILQFVNRPPSASAKFTVSDLETYVNRVHGEYVKTSTCGFDQFADHHWAYDGNDRGETLSSVAKKLDAKGYKYRWFSVNAGVDDVPLDAPGGMSQIYAFDPSGWTLQLDWLPGDDVPRRLPTYSAACKSNDGCYGQGLCNNDGFIPF